ncbi:MAG: uroporphyrinogen decarboxylase family protein [Bacteroidales bacterium]
MNRFIRLLDEKKIEKMPFLPCLDGYAQSGLPEEYQQQHIIEMQMQLGSDMLRGVEAYKDAYHESVVHLKERKGEYETEQFSTPIGTIRKVSRFVPESPFIPFPTEYLIKTVDDLKIFRYVLEHTNPIADFGNVEYFRQKYPRKILSASMQDSPFYDLLTKQIGIENFTFMYMEDPSELELTMEAMMKVKNRYVELSAQSPADVIICYENTNTANSMPDWIQAYAFPQLDEFAAIAHQYDKPLLVHMCGKINLLLDKIAERKFDGIIEISPPPTGDCDFPKAIQIMEKAGKIMAGGIECNQFTLSDNTAFEESVEKFLDSLPESPYFFLGSGDAVPKGVTAENLMSAYRISSGRKRKRL